VETLLNDPQWRKWADRTIARRCNVSHPFVAKVREELTPPPQASGNGFQTDAMPTTRTVERGRKTYDMDTRGIGKRDKAPPPVEEQPALPFPTEAASASPAPPAAGVEPEGCERYNAEPVTLAEVQPAGQMADPSEEDTRAADVTPEEDHPHSEFFEKWLRGIGDGMGAIRAMLANPEKWDWFAVRQSIIPNMVALLNALDEVRSELVKHANMDGDCVHKT
jgi:hypothetical protein